MLLFLSYLRFLFVSCCLKKIVFVLHSDRDFLSQYPQIAQQFEQFWRANEQAINDTMLGLVSDVCQYFRNRFCFNNFFYFLKK